MADAEVKNKTESNLPKQTPVNPQLSAEAESKSVTEDRASPTSDEQITRAKQNGEKWGWRFWTIIGSLCITSLLTAIESTVTSTALPSIANTLNSRELYVWFVNSIFLSSAVVQPLFGQLADVFGRRWPCIFTVAMFALGSGIAGGANSAAMLIIGRVFQGIGLGGVNCLLDMIVCDLVPMRKRGAIMGVIFAVFSAGSSIGPFVGGVLVDRVSWRWVFYIGLPVAGAALVLLVMFLHVEYEKTTSVPQKLKRLDYTGNLLLVLAMVSILIALTYGGTLRPWSSWRTIVPLVLGFLGMVAFHVYEASGIQREPVMPPRLFKNRSSFLAFILVFLHGMILYWVIYFLPVYFQSVLLSSPTRSGVQLLPTLIIVVPFGILAGGLTTATGKYKPFLIIGFALQTLGVGLFSMLDSSSSTALWAVFQIICAAGIGMVSTTILTACQVELPESDVATSTATWGFLRSLGSIWGIAIPAAVFNNRFAELSVMIEDEALRLSLQNGAAYEKASAAFINSLPEPVRSQTIATYTGALKQVWQIAIAFSALGFLVAWGVRSVEMRKTLETDYGLKEKEGKENGGEGNKA
ncbi:MFS general substrate transporter [Massarina eburnea CBS 473.64]|uniref:MFS general substrate transporter n=1 Tax=Massarina eburnea CBS 473.64 TaxID=1395130 RepID=A0A6A6S754_9PLEO|nr:MFS general substrate transporter [Massarina eburnea CBS 473.64]